MNFSLDSIEKLTSSQLLLIQFNPISSQDTINKAKLELVKRRSNYTPPPITITSTQQVDYDDSVENLSFFPDANRSIQSYFYQSPPETRSTTNIIITPSWFSLTFPTSTQEFTSHSQSKRSETPSRARAHDDDRPLPHKLLPLPPPTIPKLFLNYLCPTPPPPLFNLSFQNSVLTFLLYCSPNTSLWSTLPSPSSQTTGIFAPQVFPYHMKLILESTPDKRKMGESGSCERSKGEIVENKEFGKWLAMVEVIDWVWEGDTGRSSKKRWSDKFDGVRWVLQLANKEVQLICTFSPPILK